MSEVLWCWRTGNKQVYTRNFAIAEEAMNNGFPVMILQDKPHIFRKKCT